MPRAAYDPRKAHDYYERTKELKGRKHGSATSPSHPHPSQQQVASAEAKVAEIQAKLGRLRELLRAKVADEKKSSSSSKKPTQADKLKDRKDSKQYRDTHKQQIKNLQKGASKGAGGSSSSSTKTASSMSSTELKTAIRNTVVQLQHAITAARQLKGG